MNIKEAIEVLCKVDKLPLRMDVAPADLRMLRALACSVRFLLQRAAILKEDGTLADEQVTGQVSDIIMFEGQADPATPGVPGKIYVNKDTGKAYTWNGTGYVELPDSVAVAVFASRGYLAVDGDGDVVAVIPNGTQEAETLN